MRNRPRVVLDTNVLVSGTIVQSGFPARILALAVAEQVTLIVSPYLLAEYLNVIQRPHIAKKYANLVTALTSSAVSFKPMPSQSRPRVLTL